VPLKGAAWRREEMPTGLLDGSCHRGRSFKAGFGASGRANDLKLGEEVASRARPPTRAVELVTSWRFVANSSVWSPEYPFINELSSGIFGVRLRLFTVRMRGVASMPVCRHLGCNTPIPRGGTMCPSCGHFTFKAEPLVVGGTSSLVSLNEQIEDATSRYRTGAWDPVWGGSENPGVDKESIYMFAGLPGVGKSTLAFQTLAPILSETLRPALYLGDEQTPRKLARQWTRLALPHPSLILAPRERGEIEYPISEEILALEPCAIVQDSLPGFEGADYAASLDMLSGFREIADKGTPVFVVNHVNSAGEMAGWMQFEHLVDWVGMIEPIGRRDEPWRRFRANKSRLGDTCSMVLEMGERGLRAHESDCKCEICKGER
jgi:hypothetical protein